MTRVNRYKRKSWSNCPDEHCNASWPEQCQLTPGLKEELREKLKECGVRELDSVMRCSYCQCVYQRFPDGRKKILGSHNNAILGQGWHPAPSK